MKKNSHEHIFFKHSQNTRQTNGHNSEKLRVQYLQILALRGTGRRPLSEAPGTRLTLPGAASDRHSDTYARVYMNSAPNAKFAEFGIFAVAFIINLISTFPLIISK